MTRALPHYRDFRRYAAPAQVAQQLIPKTIPAPTRGLVLNENPAFMQPSGSLVLDNWFTTEKSIRMRGGSQTWATLTETAAVMSLFSYVTGAARKMFAANLTKLYEVTSATATLIPGITITNGHFSTAQLANAGGYWLLAANDAGDYLLRYNGTAWTQLNSGTTAWAYSHAYAVGDLAYDTDLNTHWRCLSAHTSAASGTFAADRASTAAGKWTSTATDGVSWITGPVGTPVVHGLGLTQVWKYRRRLFFVQGGSMNAWYLDVDAVGGPLFNIPLSGSFTKGGALLFGCSWSVSAGDGIDDKCIFVTTEGEIAVFTGTNPGDFQNWRQQGRYQMAKPMGKNSWLNIGGDVLIITVDGIVPMSQALVKDVTALEFSALTRSVHPLWKEEILDKSDRPWSMCKWDEFGALFVTTPGGFVGEWSCFVANTVTGAWSRFTGWDALQFCTLSGNMYFGTQDGRVVQADVKGKDYSHTRPAYSLAPTILPWQNSHPYETIGEQVRDIADNTIWLVAAVHISASAGTFAEDRAATTGLWTLLSFPVEGDPTFPLRSYGCTYVGGWEVFGDPPFVFTLRQARVAFNTRSSVQFVPQITACINYFIGDLPPLPSAGPDIGPAEVWDEGLWGSDGAVVPPDPPPIPEPEAGAVRWDQPGATEGPVRTTWWVSIGETGLSHAPVVQVSVFQEIRPDVELLGLSMLAEKAGVAV